MDTERIAGPSGMTASDLLGSDLSWVLQKSVLPVVAAVTVALVLLGRRYGHQRRLQLPPGPRTWPVIGAFLSMNPILHVAFEKLAEKYGPVVHFRLGVQPIVLVSSAEVVEELLKHKDVEFADRSITMNKLLSKYTGLDGAVMAFANYDPDFWLWRKIAITELFTGAKPKAYEELRGKEMAVMVEKILSQIERSSNHNRGDRNVTVLGIREAATDMIQNIIFMMFIGMRFDDLPATDDIREFPQIHDGEMAFVMKFNLLWSIILHFHFGPQKKKTSFAFCVSI